jgi:hypothetical protein
MIIHCNSFVLMENNNPIYPGSIFEKSAGHDFALINKDCKMMSFYDMGAMIT